MKLLKVVDKLTCWIEDWTHAGGVFNNADRWTAVAFVVFACIAVAGIWWPR